MTNSLKELLKKQISNFDKRFPQVEIGEFMSVKLYADKELKHYINAERYQDWPEFYHYTKDGKKITPNEIKSYIKSSQQELLKFLREEKITGETSDGYHTFNELYEHRFELWINLCRYFIQGKASYDNRNVWMSKLHSDGTLFDGWFIMGIGKEKGSQITYHLPMKRWEECEKISEVLEKAPPFDGHTSKDILERLKSFYV
jgi:hypothetical protein